MVTRYVPIAGTDSWEDVPFKRLASGNPRLWWKPGSTFTSFLERFDLGLLFPASPFIWNTNLSGIFGRRDLRDWQAAGVNLEQYFELPKTALDDRNVIAHSHGLQVVLFACAYGLEIRNLISVGSPVRADMMEAAEIARKRIGFWLHISDPSDDTIQIAGEWFDGSLRVQRKHPLADINDQVPGISHSKILYDEASFHWWTDQNWPEFLKRETGQKA